MIIIIIIQMFCCPFEVNVEHFVWLLCSHARLPRTSEREWNTQQAPKHNFCIILPLLRSLSRIIVEVSYQMRVSKLGWSILYDVKISRSKGSQTISSSGILSSWPLITLSYPIVLYMKTVINWCVCVFVCVGMFMWFMRTQICYNDMGMT